MQGFLNTPYKYFFSLLMGFAFCSISSSGVIASDIAYIKPDTSDLDEQRPSIFQFLNRDGILEMTMTTDVQRFIQSRATDDDQKATISFKKVDGTVHDMAVKIEPRGKFRRLKCEMPPIRLDFSKKRLKEQGIKDDFDKLKLVTHCLDSEESEQEVLREYWAYRLFNQLTEFSFKVQLVRLTCEDSENPDSTSLKYAFLIENDDEMAERLNGEILNSYNFDYRQFNKVQCHNFLLFQYMIGNTEWSVENQRNIKIIQPDDGGRPFVVPYDFDFSGLVNASYAKPNPDLNQIDIFERICMGVFASETELESTCNTFLDLKDLKLDAIKSDPYLSKDSKKHMIRYLKSFYRIIKNPNQDELQLPFTGEATIEK